MVETELTANIRHAIAYQFGAITFYTAKKHKIAKSVKRRTLGYQRLYKNDICKCDNDECIITLWETHAYAETILNDPHMFASYNTGIIDSCFGEFHQEYDHYADQYYIDTFRMKYLICKSYLRTGVSGVRAYFLIMTEILRMKETLGEDYEWILDTYPSDESGSE